ncbi:MAG TPA: hypothetical protein VL202_17510 [Pararhizobium sp.]|uniref:hypothetical protein n=1 Tax=Pararhizobium sp. TaxID=1977563 RepID=UPI002BFD7CAF|nr:hypothetical protein [Pararhizobium sp.]HTO32957.1 hypothetical protein [Pararhizobium sp.]
MAELIWKGNRLQAEFFIPDGRLRVSFERAELFRVRDEMPLSTEETWDDDSGLISNHFAYVVENSAFWNMQSEALKACNPKMKHFRFITGWTCLDVLANCDPNFDVIVASIS